MAAKGKAGLTAAEEEQVIKNRFLTQMSVPKGAIPLRLLFKKWLALMSIADKGSPEDVDKAFMELSRELAQMELTAKRLQAISQTNTREQANYAVKQQEVEQAIEQAKLDIEERKLELKKAKEVKEQNEQYEIIRNLINALPRRADTQAAIDRELQQTHDARVEEAKAAALMEKRKKQFALLMHVIEDLQRTCDDTQEELGGESLADRVTAGGTPEPMQL